ncbi:hypothetical protein SFRURICE_014904, partial [Spodoptera frugiperda]
MELYNLHSSVPLALLKHSLVIFKRRRRIVTPFIPEWVDRGAHYGTCSLPDPGIEPETSYLAVAFATTRLTTQTLSTDIQNYSIVISCNLCLVQRLTKHYKYKTLISQAHLKVKQQTVTISSKLGTLPTNAYRPSQECS